MCLIFYMSSASHNTCINIQEDSKHHGNDIPEIVSEDHEGYESIKFTDIKFYPSKAIQQQLYSYKYTWYWRIKPTSFMVWLWHLKLNSTTENRGVFSQTKKVPQWKVRCLKNKWFYSSAGHYRYSSNRIDLLVVYFNLCFLNLWRYLRTILTCKSDGNAKQIYKCNLVLLQYSMHVIFLCVKIWILDLNTWFRKY